MTFIRRTGRALVLVSFAAAAAGCCVLPFGGRGPRGHGGYHYQNGPSAADRGYDVQPAPSAPPRRW